MLRTAWHAIRAALDLPTTLALVATASLAVAAGYLHPAGPFAVIGVLALAGALLAARQPRPVARADQRGPELPRRIRDEAA